MSKRHFQIGRLGLGMILASLAVMMVPAGADEETVNEVVVATTPTRPLAQPSPYRVTGVWPMKVKGDEIDRGADTDTRSDNDNQINAGRRIAVVIEGLSEWIGSDDAKWPTVRLVVNGSEVKGLQPSPPRALAINTKDTPAEGEPTVEKNALVFDLERLDRTGSDTWKQLVQNRRIVTATANISVAFEGKEALPSSVQKKVVLVDEGLGYLAAGFSVLVIAALLWLAARHDLLSNSGEGQNRPYSLARCQTAWWFVLILCSYLFLSLMLETTVNIPGSVLGLMGIAAGTFVAAELVGSGGGPKESRGLLKDLLSSEQGHAFHRFQMFVWTLVLGAVFVIRVINNLEMPEFDTTLLGLLGISNGTYLGMKVPELDEPAGNGGAAEPDNKGEGDKPT